MPTGAKKGLNAYRQVGSGVNNHGISEYTIASGYGTTLGLGDPVKLHTDGSLVIATNDSADAIGVFNGVSYKSSTGDIVYSKTWAASTVATEIVVLVMDSPSATYSVVGDGPIPLVQKGDIFAMTLTTADIPTGQSQAVAAVLATVEGDVDIDGSVDLPTDTDVTANDTFTVKASDAASATTITFVASYDTVTLLADLIAVDNITASVDGTSGFLTIQATNGYDLVIAEGTGTPFLDLFGVAAGTFSEVVAASAGMVKVIDVVDTDTYQMEVVLVDHDLRDDG